MLAHRLKLGILGTLRHMPGAVGAAAANRYYLRRQDIGSRETLRIFAQTLEALPDGAVCVDLGANLGDITERLAAKAGHVHAFEPDPWTFEQLRERVGHLPNVTLHRAAIGTSDGTVTLRRPKGFEDDPQYFSIGCKVSDIAVDDADYDEAIEVKQIDIVRFLAELDWTCDLLKMDIEGAEVPVLNALLDRPEARRLGPIFVETHETSMPNLRRASDALRRRALGSGRPLVYFDWP